ncbi:MAG: MarR family transcriptional regulator [Spirochaetaceae bacterium]|jgi:DNA-binding MarR family transcriptional regulator|nr:MarR family transcriptional regulator [Spirochaetaceae bacterium]
MNKEEQVVIRFRDLFNKWGWLNKLKMESRFKGYTSSEVHCVELIGKNANANETRLAESFYMTRGAISKMTKKLIKKGLIESCRKPDNRKEICFRLTGRGEEINKAHEELHKAFRERDKAVFEQVSEEQFDAMLDFVERYSRHLDAEIKKLALNSKPE